MLRAVTDSTTARAAFDEVTKTFGEGGTRFVRSVGWQGGGGQYPVVWRPEERIWALLEPNSHENRFWCCYGLDDLTDAAGLTIACEINPPHEGVNLRLSGMFVQDDDGELYLGYTGRIAGGRKGIGKSAFLDRYLGGGFQVVSLGGNKDASVLILGAVGSEHLPSRVAHLVREVARIKEDIVRGVPLAPGSGLGFKPEFQGVKRGYQRGGQVEVLAGHGLVVSSLAGALRSRGLEPHNDQARDLFIVDFDRHMSVLFEVKTSLETTDVYGGVGRLMLNGKAQEPNVKCVLVLPGIPLPRTERALSAIGIQILSYRWERETPVVAALDGLI